MPTFANLPPTALPEVAARLREERYPPGEAIVAEGEASDRLFLIVSGAAEVTADGPSGPVPLASLGLGQLFGEAGLLHSPAWGCARQWCARAQRSPC